jgi:hypothetical protein
VDLFEPHRFERKTQRFTNPAAILGDRARIISDMSAEVERVERRATDAAAT